MIATKEHDRMEHPSMWERVADTLWKIGGFISVLVASFGLLRYLPRVIGLLKTGYELSIALEGKRLAETAAREYRMAAEMYKQLHEDDRARAAEAVRRADDAIDLLDIGIAYIVDLLNHIKSGRPMELAPSIPEELEQGVHDAIAKRAAAREAPKAEPPFPRAPEGA